jgi:hypothetical protein
LTYDEHPAGLSVTDPEFLPQFIKMVSAVSGLLRGESNTMPYIILGSALPFLAGVSGEKGITPPTAQVDSATLQHRLVRTVIEAIDTIWAVCPSARIIHADPVFHFGRSSHHNQPHPLAALYDRERCRIWDMIAGRTAPELGGQPHYLGLLEVACPSSHQAADNAASPHRLLGRTLDKLYQRYRRPLLVTVPDYGQVTRFGQLQALYHELQAARHAGLPIDGLCLPPTFSRPQPINAPSQPRFPAATSANFHQLPLAAEARAFA